MRTLVAEFFSPWSEKARWALDHHRLRYVYREHVPLVGEPALRLLARRPTGRVSTPLLITPHGVLLDSFAIARHADRIGEGPELFPREHDEAIASWNQRSEAALEAARALYLDRFSRSDEAKLEMQPSFVPKAMRPASARATDLAVAFLRKKYAVGADLARAEESLASELEGLRAGLSSGKQFLVGDGFTYADIAMAVTLQMVAPVADRFIALGPATRQATTHPGLAERHADLIAWRDALYEKLRPARRMP